MPPFHILYNDDFNIDDSELEEYVGETVNLT